MLDEFLALSALLTGFRQLDPRMAERCLERLSDPMESAEPIAPLMSAYREAAAGGDMEAALRARIASDPRVAALARNVIMLWYTSALPAADGKSLRFDTQWPEAYFGALMWSAVGAHPPALPGEFFGHWRYGPEQ